MTARRGFLSLLQYSPDPLRSEAVYVGVVLLDPDTKRLGFRSETDYDRAKRKFAWAGADKWWLEQIVARVKGSLEQQHEGRSLRMRRPSRFSARDWGGRAAHATAGSPYPRFRRFA